MNMHRAWTSFGAVVFLVDSDSWQPLTFRLVSYGYCYLTKIKKRINDASTPNQSAARTDYPLDKSTPPFRLQKNHQSYIHIPSAIFLGLLFPHMNVSDVGSILNYSLTWCTEQQAKHFQKTLITGFKWSKQNDTWWWQNDSLPGSVSESESKVCVDKNKKQHTRRKVSKLLTSLWCRVSLATFPSYSADFAPLLFTPSSLQHPAPITPDPQEVDTMDWK